MIKSIDKINSVTSPERLNQTRPFKKTKGLPFDQILKNASDKLENSDATNQNLKFSNHAIERMRERGIFIKPKDMNDLNEALEKAKAKGSENTLIVGEQSAFLVNVKNQTVITAIDKTQMKDNIFTKIDSTIFL